MGETNSEWSIEQERVNEVVKEIEKKEARLEENTGGLKKEIIELRENFWEDVTVNLDEPDDVIETHTSLRQQAELLAERERTHGGAHQQLKTLKRLKDSPYFGRIDFKDSEDDSEESIYLGIASLMNEDETDFLIYDWRAPISSLYYDFAPGEADYKTPSGKIEGVMTLKRQFIIRESIIKGMFDTGITIGDELLQEVLSNHSNQQMKSIVATIQKEQNQIIRNTKANFLVVQGAAGSGKTSAVLQRIAFLLYRFRESLNTNNMVMFSPNPLFNSYISTVLPELGEENITQTTFLQYLEQHVGKGFSIEDPFDQLEATLTPSEHNDIRLKSIQFKATLAFKNLLDTYLNQLGSESGLIFKPLKFRGTELVSSKGIANFFYALDPALPISNRIDIVADWLYQKTRDQARKERDKEWVEEAIGLLDKETYAKVHHKIQKRRKRREIAFDDMDLEEQFLKKLVINRQFKKIRRGIKEFQFIDHQAIYKDLFTRFESKDVVFPDDWNSICQLTEPSLEQNHLFFEDATPFLYLKEKIEGRKKQLDVRHVFIDEAQDYTPFQMAFIQEVFPTSKFTVLGDFSQAIYPHTLNLKTILDRSEFDTDEQERIELTQSYRSTAEITEFTKALLIDETKIVPFNRHGIKPTVVYSKDATDHLNQLLSRIGEITRNGHETVAVICKTAEESRQVYEALHPHISVQLMTQDTAAFHKGVIVLPTYLAKGIEFDAVIIFNASEAEYGNEALRRLFYTACTRAMHELHLISHGTISHFVENAPTDLYANVYSFFR